MPARSVVLERLVKWNGETHADITPGEYTQLTGRAGRRGIDVEGHAVVLWQPGVDPVAVAGLASTRTYPLRSSLPPDVQHGGQPGRPGRPRTRAGDPGDLVRAVPGRPGRRRAGPAGAPQHRGARRLPRGDDLRPRRLPGLRRAAPGDQGPGDRAGPQPVGVAQGRGRAEPGGPADRRRDPGAERTPGRLRRRRRAGPVGRAGRAQADDPDRRPAGEAADGQRPAGAGRDGRPGPGAAGLQRPQPAVPPRPGLDPAHRGAARPAAGWPGRSRPGRRRRTPSWPGCAASCGRTPATPARTARTTPAGASAGPGCGPRPTACSAGWRAGPTRWPGPSTGSASC